MLSIFSNYLTPIYGEDLNSKPSEVYEMLRYTYSLGGVGILNNTRMVSVGNDDDDYDIICESFRNEDFKAWIQWVNKKITLELGKLDYRAIDVRIRIFTSTLNKLVDDWYVPDDIAKKIHHNLTSNIRQEMSEINTEDLPF